MKTDGQTDMKKLIMAFSNPAKASKKQKKKGMVLKPLQI